MRIPRFAIAAVAGFIAVGLCVPIALASATGSTTATITITAFTPPSGPAIAASAISYSAGAIT
jgi:hypothetical protein